MQATPVTFGYTSLSAVAASHSLAEALAAAAQSLSRVLGGDSLSEVLGDLKRRAPAPALAAAAQDLCYNALRGYGVFDVALDRLLQKPLSDIALRGLLL